MDTRLEIFSITSAKLLNTIWQQLSHQQSTLPTYSAPMFTANLAVIMNVTHCEVSARICAEEYTHVSTQLIRYRSRPAKFHLRLFPTSIVTKFPGIVNEIVSVHITNKETFSKISQQLSYIATYHAKHVQSARLALNFLDQTYMTNQQHP